MKFIVTRKWFSPQSTIGELHIPETGFRCYTLEDVARALGVKLYGMTAIPEGIHKMMLTHSARFKRVLPIIYNQPDGITLSDGHGASWTGIRCHGGRTHIHTEGCLLWGKTRGADSVSDSVTDEAMTHLLKVCKLNTEYEIQITNQQIR